jgi:hypothetical protein
LTRPVERHAGSRGFNGTASSANPPQEESSLPASGPYAESQATSTPQTGDDVARTIMAAATDERPHLRHQTSELARALASRKVIDPSGDPYLDMMAGMMGTPARSS